MELYQLRTLVAVAEVGNFTRAGKRVHATQPAVSAHIKALEQELGVQLFHRTPRGVELTTAGSELIGDAIEVLAATDKLQARAVTLQGEVTGKVALGLCADPDYLKVSRLIEDMTEQFPKLNLMLLQSPSGPILSAIRAKELDAGFVFSGNPYGDLESIKLAKPKYSIMGAYKWRERLAKGDAAELSKFTWVIPASHSAFRELQLSIFKKHGISPAQTIGADSEEVIRPLIVEGKALALVREDEAETMLQAEEAAPCALVGQHQVEVNFVFRKTQADNPAIGALIAVVREQWGV